MHHRGRLSKIALGMAVVAAGCTSSGSPDDPKAGSSPSPPGARRFRYGCQPSGFIFDPVDLEGPGGLEADDPELRELVDSLERSNRETVDGWRVVYDDGERVGAMARVPGGGFLSVSFERVGDRWAPNGVEDCEPRVYMGRGRRTPATWELAEEPAPGDTRLALLVHEATCSGGRKLTERNTRADVDYAEDAITIVMTGDRPRDITCPDNPRSPVEIELDEPVGERELIDAGIYPPEQRHP